METFLILAAVLAAVFLVYGLLMAAGIIDEDSCSCAACRRARHRDWSKSWD